MRGNIRGSFYILVQKFCKDKKKLLCLKLSYVPTLGIFSLFTKKAPRQTKTVQYPSIVQQADKLFEDGKYVEAYDLLNTLKADRIKFYTDIEVLWRICRSLHKMSCDSTTTKNVQKELLDEAFKIINIALQGENKNANVHKWMAIILDARCGFEGTLARVRNASLVKQHLLKALELAPNDFTLLYMLGHWCFNMSSLNWFQKKVATFMFGNIPESTYEEASKYFLRAEELQPRFFIPNTFMLGKVSYYLNQYFRARYYLNEAGSLLPQNEYEKKCVLEARKLAAELEFYDVAREAIIKTFF